MLKRMCTHCPMYWPAQCSSDNCIVHDSTAKLEESTLLVAMAVKTDCMCSHTLIKEPMIGHGNTQQQRHGPAY